MWALLADLNWADWLKLQDEGIRIDQFKFYHLTYCF